MKSFYLNELIFGNPSQHQLKIINTPNYLENIVDVGNFPPPNNDSIVTLQELNIISENIEKIAMYHNSDKLTKFLEIDTNFKLNIINHFKESFDLDFSELIDNISDDLEPLILKLKYYYNRPRPNQLAALLKLKLAPFNESLSPSYPCSHTLLTKVFMNIISQKHPELEEDTKLINEVVSDSRIYLGLNYPSDNDFSEEIAQLIFSNESFKIKYNINETKIVDE